MNCRIVLLAQLILLLLSLIEAATFMEMVYGLLQIGKEETHNNGISYPIIRDGVRRQQIISETIQFPCDTNFGRSSSVPNSVHRLRPGDIDVVGGMGDSLVAACGALEEYALGAFIEARGVSWCAGGEDNWRKFVTLPNMLKMFNPNLTGYATGTGELLSARSKLNVAFPVAATEDALHQARLIVQRIKNDPNIDFKNQWKLITILFGANDICSAQCYSPKKFSPMRHALYLRRALDFLKATLPRTVVNLVPTIDVTVSARVTKSAMCNIIHPLYCACMHQGHRPDIKASKMTVLYQQAVDALISSGRYDKSPDFTVVIQPFTEIFNAPNSDPTKAFRFDSSLITYDCFHFSQKGHALAANLLWNNMMEPVGNKTTTGLLEILERVVCPTEKNPYIFTNVNSKLFYETGSQDGISPR